MINFEHIGLFGTNRHFLVTAKEWWLENTDRFKNWNVLLDPKDNTLRFINYEDHCRNFYVFLLKDDYASIQARRFDIIVNPPDFLEKYCYYRLSSMYSFISHKNIFDILAFILSVNNEMDCLDYQSMKNSFGDYCTPVINAVPSNIVAKFSKDEIPTYIACTTDRPLTDCFVTVSDPLKDEFKVKDSSLGMKSNKVFFDEFFTDDSFQKFVKDLLNLKFGKGGIDMDIRNKIEDVIFNGPATIVKWTDGTKTVVKCKEGEINNPYMGLAMCISKKVLGNRGNFNDVFKKWITSDVINPYMTAPQEGN